MKRMKRWLSMSLAVLMITSTLLGDYVIAHAAEVSAAEGSTAEQQKETEGIIATPEVFPIPEATAVPEAAAVSEVTSTPSSIDMPEEVITVEEAASPEADEAPEESTPSGAAESPATEAVEASASPEVIEELTQIDEETDIEIGDEAKEGYVTVTFAVTPENAAGILGKAAVEENTEYFFEVEAKEGYQVTSVEAFSLTDEGEKEELKVTGSVKKGYSVMVAKEDVTLLVTCEKIADKEEEKASEAMTLVDKRGLVTIYAPAGVLSEGAYVEVHEIFNTSGIEAAAEKENIEVADVIAYDIKIYDEAGNEIKDFESSVTVTFNQVQAPAQTDVDEAAVYHYEDGDLDRVARVDAGADTVEFKAEHFSIYVYITANEKQYNEYTISVGETVTLNSDNSGSNWSVNRAGNSVARITESTGTTAIVEGLLAGTATITHEYRSRRGTRTETYTIHVTESAQNMVAEGIHFKYYTENQIDDTEYVGSKNTIKFTVECYDTNGNKVETLPTGTVVPSGFSFDTNLLTINASTFSGISVPGYTFDKGFSYFYWSGNQLGEMAPVYTFKNFGKLSNGHPEYDSYIGFTTSFGKGGDYTGDTEGYYAYNPTGTLRLRFRQVDEAEQTYKTYYVSSDKTVGTYEDNKVNGSYYPVNKLAEYTEAYMNANKAQYAPDTENSWVFKGWCTTKDNTGNGTGAVVDDTFFASEINTDIWLYAKWENLTVAEEVVVTIKENSDTVVYDGSEKNVTGYTVKSISNSLYTASDFTFSGEAVAKGTAAGSYDMQIKASDFTNHNTNFTNVKFVIEDGQLTITPITKEVIITITENGGTAVYDGSEKCVTGYEVTSISNTFYTASDFTFNGVAEAKGTKAGSYDMNIKAEDFQNNNTNFTKVTFNIIDNQLIITPTEEVVVVKIKENSATYAYDGSEKTVTGYEVTDISNALYTEADFSFKGEAKASGTNVGSYDMNVKAEDFQNNNTSFKKVTFVVTDGQLTITPSVEEVTVTVKENSATYAYDDSEKSVTGYTVTNISNSLYTAADFTFSGEAVAKGTAVGSYDMEVEASDFTNQNANFANVKFVIEDGQLTITPITEEVVVTITENSDSVIYNGSEQSITGYQVTDISNSLYKEADFTFNGVAEANGIEAGTYDMEVKPTDFVNTNANFTNVEFKVIDGALTITPVTKEVVVTIKENSAAYTFDGSEKSVTGYEVTTISNDLYKEADFIFNGVAEAKGTKAGSYDMNVKAEDFENQNANFTNVTFKIVDGQLVISPTEDEVVVIITENSGTYTYDKTEKSVEGYVVTDISSELYTEADFTFTGNDVVSGTEVGTYDMAITADDFTNINGDFAKVTFVIVDGQMVITPITEAVIVTITENSGRYTYDGMEKKVEGYVVTDISNELYTEDDFTFTGEALAKGTEAGTYDMEVEAADFANTNTRFTNVTFKIADGQLVIDPYAKEVKVIIIGKFDTVLYDGQMHSVKGYDITINNETGSEELQRARFNSKISGDNFLKAEDVKYTGIEEVVQTNAGTYAQGLNAESFTVTNDNFSNVVFEVTDGELKIEKRQVVLTSDSGRKTYDGTALTKKKVRVSGDGFAKSEGATYHVKGKQTQVGESKNKFDYTLKANTLSGNYEIKTVYGKLEILPETVTPVPEEPSPSQTPVAPTPTPASENPPVIIEDQPVPMADGPIDDGAAVLGARRTNDPGAAVLGARRGTEFAVLGKRRRPETGDSAALIFWYIALGMSVATAITATAKVRKKKLD